MKLNRPVSITFLDSIAVCGLETPTGPCPSLRGAEMYRAASVLFTALALSAIAASAALAQKTTGDITGTVMDATGAVLPGVTVNAVCAGTNFTRSVTSDAQGGFAIPELPVCVYKV